MLMNASLEWGAEKKLKELPADVYQTIRQRIPRLKLPEDKGKVEAYYQDILMDAAEAELLTDAGIELSIKRIKGLAYPDWFNAARRSGWQLPDGAHNVTYQVSVANVGLLAVDEVTVLEDCCTDTLQADLDAGWRILAVCPPNDARRPTYVMGRSKTAGAK